MDEEEQRRLRKNEINRLSWHRNAEKNKQKKKEYYEKNKEAIKQKNKEYYREKNKEIYHKTREEKLARRRELYHEKGKEKQKEYVSRMKDDENFKKRRAEASLRYYYKKQGLTWPPTEDQKEMSRRTRNRNIGNALVEYNKNKVKKDLRERRAAINRVEVAEIPDLTQAYGDTPQLFWFAPRIAPPSDNIGFNPLAE